MNKTGLKRQFKSFDFILAALILIVSVFGIIVIGSATRIDINGTTELYDKQKIWLLSGLVLMLLAAFVDYHFICKFYIPIYVVNIVILAALFFLSNQVRGVSRWMDIGGMSLQPSEFAKVFTIIFLAKFIDKENERINNIIMFLFLLFLVGLPVLLVFLQPALSAAGVILVISGVVVFAGKISYKNIFILIIFLAPIITFLYVDFISEERILLDKILEDYQIRRIELTINPSLDPELARQVEYSKHAIGSGMLHGKGIYEGTHGKSTADNENDFIFAVLGEEFGFVGCAALLVLMFLIVCKCLYTAARAPDICGMLIATGAAAMFFFQAFFHVGVTIGIMPNTGVTFPFFSYGGSSMWTCMIAAGLVINVGMSKTKSMFED